MVSERYSTDLAKETCYKHLFLGCIYCLFSLFDHDGDYIIFSLNQKNFRICYFFHILKFLLFFVILVYQIIIQITIPHSCISPIYNSSACILPHIIRKWDCWCGCFRIMCHPDLIFSDLTIFKIISKC